MLWISRPVKTDAVVVVHAGALAGIDDSYARRILGNPGHGSYEQYIRNLDALMAHLSNSGSNIPLFMVGQKGTEQYLLDRNPPKHARTLYWEKGGTCVGIWRLVGEITADGGSRDYDWKDMKKEGIVSVLVAGEMGMVNGEHECVVEIAREMIGVGLEVRGVKDCIYPLNPTEPIYGVEELTPIVEALYRRAVEITMITG